MSDIHSTRSCHYGYADLALLYSNKSWEKLEKILSADMCVIADFLSALKLKLNVTKTTSTAFHVNNKETKRQLAVNVRGNTPPNNPNPTCPGVKLDRQLTSKQQILVRNNLLPALLARLRVPLHPPFVQQLLQSSLAQWDMLPQFGVVALTEKNWMLH